MFNPFLSSFMYVNLTSFEKEITIKNKFQNFEIPGSNLGGDIYMISDMENNIYSCRKSFWKSHFYNIELWNSIKENNTYKISGYGVRNGILNIYPVIIDYSTK